MFFKLGTFAYQTFSLKKYQKKMTTLNCSSFENNIFLNSIAILTKIRNDKKKEFFFQIQIKTNNYAKIQDLVSFLIFKKDIDCISLISLEFQEKTEDVYNYILSEKEIYPINHLTYNQISALPLSCNRDINLFLKRIQCNSDLIVFNMPLKISNDFDFSLFFKYSINNVKIMVNNCDPAFRNKIQHPNVINLDQCGFSLSEKIVICQHADLYFGAYDNLALGAFDSNSKGIIYLAENEIDYFTKENENFNLKKIDKVTSIKDIEKDILNFLKIQESSSVSAESL
jgi:hypothetical protein